MKVQLRSRASLRTCPYCHDALRSGPDTGPPCDGCGTVLHAACVAEVGCSTLGCPRTPSADLKNPRAPWRATAEAAAAAAAARSWGQREAATSQRQRRLDAVRSQLLRHDPDPDGLGARPKVTHLLFAIGLLMAALCVLRLVTTIGVLRPEATRLVAYEEATRPIR